MPSIPETDEVKRSEETADDREDSDAHHKAAEEDSALDQTSPLWTRDGWTLTWPIWHLLPLDERKRLAKEHGYKTIGEFEEYMSLHQAMDDSETIKPYANERIYASFEKERLAASHTDGDLKPAAKTVKKEDSPDLEPGEKGDDEDEDDDYSDSDEKPVYEKQASTTSEDLSYEELLAVAGQILMLHDEILHQVFAWLPVDAYATLALVSPHWKNFTRTEAVYKRLCERLYLNQSKRRQLHVSRFGGSYRTMLEERPRVRAAGGCYVLKYAQVKKIQRDMWTEVSDTMCGVMCLSSAILSSNSAWTRYRLGLFWRASTTGIYIFKRTDVCCTH